MLLKKSRGLVLGVLAGTCASLATWNLPAQEAEDAPPTQEALSDSEVVAPPEVPVDLQPKVPTIEIVRPGGRVPSTPAPAAKQQVEKVFRPTLSRQQERFLAQSRVERERSIMQTQKLAQQLEVASEDVFSRGLLPVFDYADQSATALEMRLAAADLLGDRGARVAALEDHAAAMDRAVKLYEEFDQPASSGRLADLTYARLLSARAEAALASVKQNASRAETARALTHQLAEEHLEIRQQEFEVGSASLEQYLRAGRETLNPEGKAFTVTTLVENQPAMEAYQGLLRDLLPQLKQFAEQGAGIGRVDQVTQVEFELSRISGWKALTNGNLQGVDAEFTAAQESAATLLAQQAEFYKTGTAHISDLIRTWRDEFLLEDQAQRQDLVPSDDVVAVRQEQYAQLGDMADALKDRSGRNASDVLHLESLGALEGLWARQQAVQAVRDAQIAQQKATPVPASQPRIRNLTDEAAQQIDGVQFQIIKGRPSAVQAPGAPVIEIVKPVRVRERVSADGSKVIEIRPAAATVPTPEAPAPEQP